MLCNFQLQLNRMLEVITWFRVCFNLVATNQAVVQTIMREGKSQDGVGGFTLLKAALKRWLMTSHVITAYFDAMKDLYHTDDKSSKAHQENATSRMDREERWQDSFDLDSFPDKLTIRHWSGCI